MSEQWVEERTALLDKKVHKLIAKLGPDEKSVLKEIRKDNIKAIPKATCECILALWFNIRLGSLNANVSAHVKRFVEDGMAYEKKTTLVGSIYVTACDGCLFKTYILPLHVAQVMWDFDQLEYPDLVDEAGYRKLFA